MRRFTKVALLLAAMSVLACSAAFAVTYPLENVPGALFAPTDVFLISQDVSGVKPGDLIVSPDATGKPGTTFLNFTEVDIISRNIVSVDDGGIGLSNKHGGFGLNSADNIVSADFDKLLIRTTADTFNMTFKVNSTDWRSGTLNKFMFGLRGGYERNIDNKGKRTVYDLARDCTIACDNFYHYAQHVPVISPDSLPTLKDKITWTGTGDKEFYVDCCENFGLVAASVDRGVSSDTFSVSRSRDFVVAHLSETPFLRVRATEAHKVLTDVANDKTVLSNDFRAWNTDFYNTTVPATENRVNSPNVPVDVPEGQVYNMGVQYATSTDCSACGVITCTNEYLPFIAVTNLGEKSVYIGDNVLSGSDVKVPDWLCNAWCGLCEFDDMMSGDKGSFGYSKTNVDGIKAQSALYDCVCHIYPAFSNTFKAAGNVDWDYKAYKTDDKNVKIDSVVTSIRGRFNTAWWRESITTSTLCSSCVDNIDIYMPCDCLEQLYRDALSDNNIVFATKKTVAPEDYNDVIADDATKTVDDYAVVDAVVKVKDPSADSVPNILVTKLNWTVPASDLNGVGLVTGDKWWRADIWNKLAIRVNGIKLDADNVENVSANDLSSEELNFLTIVDGPQRNLTTTTDIKVGLFVFVMDSDESAVKYYKTTDGNRFLVVYDGKKDNKFTYKAYISKGDGSAPAPEPEVFDVSASALELNIAVEADKAKTLSTKNVPLGAVVVWTVVSSDIATVSPDFGASTTVTGVAVGTTTVHAAISGDLDVSADCTITVKSEAPAPAGDSSGGGCNVGFAPAMLLLLAPLGFLKK